MTSLHLDQLLSGHVFAFLLIFSRIGAVMTLMPGIGEAYVSPRLRMMLALSFSFLVLGPLMPLMPAPPEAVSDLVKLLGYEIITGIFFGSILRLVMSAAETVGAVVALQTGLSNATVLNPAQATQSPLAAAFYSLIAVTLVFVSGLDHFLLRTLIMTYTVFPPGGSLATGDMAQTFAHAVGQSFLVGVSLAAPFIIIGLLMFVALGIMQRLMPQVQLFLVMLPLQIWGGLTVMGITVAGIMTVWMRYFDATIGSYIGR